MMRYAACFAMLQYTGISEASAWLANTRILSSRLRTHRGKRRKFSESWLGVQQDH